MYLDQNIRSVGTELGPNYLQMLSADKERKKKTFCGFSMGRNQYWAGRVYDLCVYYMTGTPEGSFCGFFMGRNQYWAGRVYDLCVYYMTGTPEGSTESGFMEKPGIELRPLVYKA